MLRKILFLLATLGAFARLNAQVLCISCADQTAAFNSTAPNLIQNGSFENTDCLPYTQQWDVFCPASSSYACDIADWSCTGGGTATYALMYDASVSTVPDGTLAAYLGSAFGNLCSSITDDLSCAVDSACQVVGIPAGYPTNAAEYGGSIGVSLEQVVSGLTVGNAYTLEFWAGGENFSLPGVFGLDVGFGYIYLRCDPTPPGATGTRYSVTFQATSTSHTIKFTNWGHMSSSSSEVVMDDVRMYAASLANVPDTFALAQIGCGAEVQCSTPANPGFTYSWNMGDNTIYNTASVDHTYAEPGIYPITLTITGAGCSGSGTITDTVTVASLGPDVVMCGGDTAHWDLSFPGASFVWQDGSILPTYSATLTGDYWVTVSAPGCSFTDTVHVDAFAPPVFDLGPDTTICNGASLTLDATSVPSGSITWQNNSSATTFTATTAGIYWARVDNNGCARTDSIDVSVSPAPVIALPATVDLCVGEDTLLNVGNPGASYLWSTGAITQAISASTTDTFSVVVTNIYGCASADSTIVTTHALPVIDLGPDTSLCVGEVWHLNAGIPGATYHWSTGAVSQTLNVTTEDTYWVSVTDAFTCAGRDTILVTYDPVPVIDLHDTTVCVSSTVVYNAGNPGSTFLWSTGETTQTIAVDSLSGLFTVTVTNAGWCTGTGSATIDRVDYPVVDLGPDLERCTVLDTVTFDAGNAGSAFEWNTGAPTQQLVVTRTGDYWVDVDNGYCITRDSVHVIFHPLPVLPLPDDTSACLSFPPYHMELDAKNEGCTFEWNNGADTRTFIVERYGHYSVVITTPDGCSLSDSTTVIEYCPPEFFMPNSFSPNGDGVNDRFAPNGNDIATVELAVFDRWGQPVWSGLDRDAAWDGTSGGEPAKQDVYVWKARYRFVKDYQGALTEYKEAIGHVTLLR